MKNKIVMGLALVILISGVRSEAVIIAYDGFNTAVSADTTDGVYQHDLPIRDDAHNANVGGDIVGFDSANKWISSSSLLRPYNNQLRLIRTTGTTSRNATRKLLASMSGKTVAYGSILMNITQSTSTGDSLVGFSTAANSSVVGATVGVDWDGSEWDIVVRYNNGSAVQAVVKDGISINTNYTVIWGMDDINNTLQVWVDAASAVDAATALFTDYAGSVSGIADAYVSYHNMGAGGAGRDGMTYDSLTLADSLKDLLPSPSLKLSIITLP